MCNIMQKPTLLILAAGMGSRYGGLKQLDGLGPHGETIMDYSVYDAVRAGFGKVVFVIRKEFENDFRNIVLSKYEKSVATEVVFQSIDALPDGFKCPPDRTKPWGTNHAVLMGADVIKEPFAVINADDFYGQDAFAVIAQELSKPRNENGNYCMVAFQVGNTMTENGSVARGVCTTKKGYLQTVVERTAISYDENKDIVYTDENGNLQQLNPDTPVSMNFWGFTPDYFEFSKREFVKFLNKNINNLKSEFFIPSVVDKLIGRGEANVNVLTSNSKWFGVTYADDRQNVVDRLAQLHEQGVYPEVMFK